MVSGASYTEMAKSVQGYGALLWAPAVALLGWGSQRTIVEFAEKLLSTEFLEDKPFTRKVVAMVGDNLVAALMIEYILVSYAQTPLDRILSNMGTVASGTASMISIIHLMRGLVCKRFPSNYYVQYYLKTSPSNAFYSSPEQRERVLKRTIEGIVSEILPGIEFEKEK